MGHHKYCLELGYTPTENKFICTKCIQEEALRYVISENACAQKCSYCRSRTTKNISVCVFDDLVRHICRSIQSEWSEPYNAGMAYDSENEEWVGDIYSTVEVLQDLELYVDDHAILEDISHAINNKSWCINDPYSMPEEQEMFLSWEMFAERVMTRSRYFFYSSKRAASHWENDCSVVLNYVGDIITRLDLFRIINAKDFLYRVRIVNPKEKLITARELGAPPVEYATLPNRMSPAGISMFYGAFDTKTAIAETYEKSEKDKVAVCGRFQPTKDLLLIDLSRQEIPSIFDEENRNLRSKLSFLFDFINDFTKSIDRKASPHVDYVPTQIVTEYLRDQFAASDGISVDGIIYPSSKSVGKSAVVIFANSDQCCNESGAEQLLELVKISRTKIP